MIKTFLASDKLRESGLKDDVIFVGGYMKEIYLTFFGFMMSMALVAADKAPEYREWDADAYKKSNWVQKEIAEKAIERSKINLNNKEVLDAGCGTCNVSKMMTETASFVYACDASKNMIKVALEDYSNVPQLTITNCPIEELDRHEELKSKFHVVTAFSVLHFVKDKPKAFRNFSYCLKPGGEVLCTITNESGGELLSRIAAREALPFLDTFASFAQLIKSRFGSNNLDAMSGAEFVTNDRIKEMIKETDLEIILQEDIEIRPRFESREHLEETMWPLMSTIPLTKMLPDFLVKVLFNRFMDKLIEKLEFDEENRQYIYPQPITILYLKKKQV